MEGLPRQAPLAKPRTRRRAGPLTDFHHEATAFIQQILATAAALREARDLAGAPALELGTTMRLLRAIERCGGAPTFSDLGRLLDMSRQAAREQALRVAARGLVELFTSPDDRRAWQVMLTPRGRQDLEAQRMPRFAWVFTLFRGLERLAVVPDKSWRKTEARNLVTRRAALLRSQETTNNGSLAMAGTITRRQVLAAGAAVGTVAAVGAAPAQAQGQAQALAGTLIQKPIPKSGERLPPIGIGTNRYGVGTSEEERAPLRDTMARFVELGGKVMDTAMIYGTSEAVIGDLAQQLDIRDKLFFATKTDIRGQLRGEAGLQQALTRMKTDTIDAMLVHNLVNVETELPVLREWQRQGKFRYIGASISTHDQFDQMERFMRDNDVEIVQFNYSLGDRLAAERLLPTAADRGIAVMINVPFGGGGRNSIFDVVEGRELPDFAAEFDATTWGQFFLKYIVSHPAVTCAIPGTRRVEHVNDNFGAAFGRLPDAALRRRQEQFFDSIS